MTSEASMQNRENYRQNSTNHALPAAFLTTENRAQAPICLYLKIVGPYP